VRRWSRSIAISLCFVILPLTACLHRQAPSTPSDLRNSSAERGYVDLQPEWNVRVVYPRLRSGGYVLPSIQQTGVAGNTIETQVDRDFLGYEQDFYKVESRPNETLAVRFTHARVWENNRTHRQSQPQLTLFSNTQDSKFIRLVYLVRESAADHDMAIISCTSPENLEQLTQAVILRAQCQSAGTTLCTWVPKGVAVDPEK
jgi:hypothetical protein